MANNYTKTMRQALQEARSFRDVQEGFSTAQIKMAYGVLNDPRYKQGNYDGAVKAIEKIAKDYQTIQMLKMHLKEQMRNYWTYQRLAIPLPVTLVKRSNK